MKKINILLVDDHKLVRNGIKYTLESGSMAKQIDKIDEALNRIENGEYGYCEETGDPIGLKRLEARAVATLCIEAQERHENYENTHVDEDKINA